MTALTETLHHPARILENVSQTSTNPVGAPLPRSLRLWLTAILCLTAINVAIELFCHFALHLHYPYDWPFVAPISRFNDLLDWVPQFRALHTEAIFHQRLLNVYPAPLSVLYASFVPFGRWALAAYLTFAFLLASVTLTFFGKHLITLGLAASSTFALLATVFLTSYPFWFLLHTANLELFVWACTLTGVWAFSREKPTTAAIFFGLAAAMKLYPLLYLALWLHRRTWPRILQSLAVAAAAMGASLWAVYPNIPVSLREMRAGTAVFIARDGLHWLPGQAGFDHSAFSFLKTILPTFTPETTARLLSAYLVLATLTATWLWFANIRHKPVLNQLLFLTIGTILLPPTSYDYTLVHLYAPWGLLVLALAAGRQPTKACWIALASLAILFTAQGYIIAAGNHFAAQLKCLALLSLAVSTATGSLFQEPATA
jgi:hypothetical protein